MTLHHPTRAAFLPCLQRMVFILHLDMSHDGLWGEKLLALAHHTSLPRCSHSVMSISVSIVRAINC